MMVCGYLCYLWLSIGLFWHAMQCRVIDELCYFMLFFLQIERLMVQHFALRILLIMHSWTWIYTSMQWMQWGLTSFVLSFIPEVGVLSRCSPSRPKAPHQQSPNQLSTQWISAVLFTYFPCQTKQVNLHSSLFSVVAEKHREALQQSPSRGTEKLSPRAGESSRNTQHHQLQAAPLCNKCIAPSAQPNPCTELLVAK